MAEILPISRFSRKLINTYGSRESRFPYTSTKGFLRRYSQSVESIFFFFVLHIVVFPDPELPTLADFTINGNYARGQNLLLAEYTYVNTLQSFQR